MYFIVETESQLSKLVTKESCFIQVVPSSDNHHPSLTTCSLVYYNAGEKGYIFPVKHSEGFSLQARQIESFINSHKKVYLLDRNYHSYFLNLKGVVDLNFIRMDQGMEATRFDCDTLIHRDFHIKYQDSGDVNELIPITKHYERCECLYKKVEVLFDLDADYDFMNRSSEAYLWVEKQGIGVDQKRLIKEYGVKNPNEFIKSGVVMSRYNMYNTTGRPTNSFKGINFVAIPKAKEFRDCFVPTNDFLVEADQDAYHLRLIANQVGYEFEDPTQSIHTQLGRIYFSKEELSEEEYHKSKEISFKQLYGGVEDAYKHIPIFKKTVDFIEDTWKKYKKDGSILLPTGTLLRRSGDMNKLKLFNYWIQNLETRNNTEKIEQLKEYMTDCKSRLVLITYDAFLFDYSVEDGKEFLIKIKSILEDGGFKIKIKHGKTYNF